MSRYFDEDAYSEEELDKLYEEAEELRLENELSYMEYQSEQQAIEFWSTL